MFVQLAAPTFCCHKYVILAEELFADKVADAVAPPMISAFNPSFKQTVKEAVVDIVPPFPIVGT
jgi:hypothetical protein